MKVKCNRCSSGKGNIPAFKNVMGGVCFKCKGAGFVERKSAPKVSPTFTFSFLWTNPEHSNFKNGDFCSCFNKKARTLKAAEKIAAQFMARNGSVDFKVELAS